jgi:hypothetical protein
MLVKESQAFFICGILLAKRKELTGPEATAKSPAL